MSNALVDKTVFKFKESETYTLPMGNDETLNTALGILSYSDAQ